MKYLTIILISLLSFNCFPQPEPPVQDDEEEPILVYCDATGTIPQEIYGTWHSEEDINLRFKDLIRSEFRNGQTILYGEFQANSTYLNISHTTEISECQQYKIQDDVLYLDSVMFRFGFQSNTYRKVYRYESPAYVEQVFDNLTKFDDGTLSWTTETTIRQDNMPTVYRQRTIGARYEIVDSEFQISLFANYIITGIQRDDLSVAIGSYEYLPINTLETFTVGKFHEGYILMEDSWLFDSMMFDRL